MVLCQSVGKAEMVKLGGGNWLYVFVSIYILYLVLVFVFVGNVEMVK